MSPLISLTAASCEKLSYDLLSAPRASDVDEKRTPCGTLPTSPGHQTVSSQASSFFWGLSWTLRFANIPPVVRIPCTTCFASPINRTGLGLYMQDAY